MSRSPETVEGGTRDEVPLDIEDVVNRSVDRGDLPVTTENPDRDEIA